MKNVTPLEFGGVVGKGKVHCRFWQRCGGYNPNIYDPETLYHTIEYIHQNPVRRGLVEKATDWIWSSARFYAGDPDVPISVDRCRRWMVTFGNRK